MTTPSEKGGADRARSSERLTGLPYLWDPWEPLKSLAGDPGVTTVLGLLTCNNTLQQKAWLLVACHHWELFPQFVKLCLIVETASGYQYKESDINQNT